MIVMEMLLFVNYLAHKSRCVFQRGKDYMEASGVFQEITKLFQVQKWTEISRYNINSIFRPTMGSFR